MQSTIWQSIPFGSRYKVAPAGAATWKTSLAARAELLQIDMNGVHVQRIYSVLQSLAITCPHATVPLTRSPLIRLTGSLLPTCFA
jgi:hypothetical protein